MINEVPLGFGAVIVSGAASGSGGTVFCRGSWMLGSACGHCDRCHEEAATIIPNLLHYKKTVERIARLTDNDMPKSHTFKLAVLEEIGRMVSEKI